MGEKMLILSHWATLPEARQPGGCLGMENKIWEWFTLFMAGLVLVETPFLTKWMIATFVLPLFAANGFCSNLHKLWLFYCHEPRQSMIVAYSGLPTSEVRNAPLEIFIGKLWNILERKNISLFGTAGREILRVRMNVAQSPIFWSESNFQHGNILNDQGLRFKLK